MSTTTLAAAMIALVKGVFALLETGADDPLYRQRARGVFELCSVALDVAKATLEGANEAATRISVPVRGDLGARIAELAAHGKGVRQIARILGVHPSTVSRRLRPKARC